VPAEHGAHGVLGVDVVNPSVHDTQPVPSVVNVFCAHKVQVVLLALDALPGAHAMQFPALVLANVPAVQGVHITLPGDGATEPAAQEAHVVCAPAKLYVPAAHRVHDDDPADVA
jgi:hypothetical protein